MSSSVDLLKYLDRIIYKGFIEQLNGLTRQAEQLNEGNGVKYLCFNTDMSSWTRPIKPKAKEFLDSQLPELAPILNERALVGAYLLRYLNQIPAQHRYSVARLMPKGTSRLKFEEEYSESIESAIVTYKQMPEFQLIKKRIFLGGMLYG